MKVGVLGGSFDPIHIGHLNLALSLKESAHLDKVFLVPAFLSPFKAERPPQASPSDRLAMVRLAVESIPGFEVLDWEIRREAPSYTIDTIRHLAQDTALQLRLLLGDDQLETFSLWREADQLIKLAPLLVGTRSFDVSSTEIRLRLHNKAYCGHLVPFPVLEYIKRNHLYA
jgi:nicotinate-nucleotide adenylyltransferase